MFLEVQCSVVDDHLLTTCQHHSFLWMKLNCWSCQKRLSVSFLFEPITEWLTSISFHEPTKNIQMCLMNFSSQRLEIYMKLLELFPQLCAKTKFLHTWNMWAKIRITLLFKAVKSFRKTICSRKIYFALWLSRWKRDISVSAINLMWNLTYSPNRYDVWKIIYFEWNQYDDFGIGNNGNTHNKVNMVSLDFIITDRVRSTTGR